MACIYYLEMPEICKVILLIDGSGALGRGLLRGIAKYSRLHGPWAFYRKAPFYRLQGFDAKTLPQLKQWGATGVILRDVKQTEDIIAMGLPTIVTEIHEQLTGFPSIVSDAEAIGKMGAEHLLNCGFTRFAYCGFDMLRNRRRHEAFSKRLATAGFEVHSYKQTQAQLRQAWNTEQTLMVDWLKSLPKPIGLMTCTDDMSQYVIEACKIAQLHIPDQVAIIGVDNDELICDLSTPPLSSIAVNSETAGYEAAQTLNMLMSGKQVTNPTILVRPTEVVTRQSTNILAIEDSEVVKAIEFVRGYANKIIKVHDVVAATTLTRRALEQRFGNILNRSIHDEIKRERTRRIAHMLTETNLSIAEIAVSLGHTRVEHLARYFRQEMGMTPLAYRKKYMPK